jgi:hypothetical protein
MAVTKKLTRREKRLWSGPQSMSGPRLRAAARLPKAAIVSTGAVCGIAAGALLTAVDEAGWPASSGFLGAVAVFWLCLLGVSLYAQARRRRLGLVQVTQPQFDLIMALSQVSPEHVLEARQLHDHLIDAIADPQNRDADVAAIEARMRRLVDGGPDPRIATRTGTPT